MSPKSPRARGSRSGSYVPDDLRGTVRLVARCSPELAERARRVAREHGVTLAQVLEAGCEAVEDAVVDEEVRSE